MVPEFLFYHKTNTIGERDTPEPGAESVRQTTPPAAPLVWKDKNEPSSKEPAAIWVQETVSSTKNA